MVQRSLSSRWRDQETITWFQQVMMYTRRYGFRDYHRCNGRQLESLVKDPTAATTNNDDSDVTTVSLSADASVTEGEHHLHGDTGRTLRMARATVTLSKWCNDHYR
ncbi:hypothetical protein OK016_19395 [Vibrio chagasii]|nr:hypothetical protein [Vibrio chagasii]